MTNVKIPRVVAIGAAVALRRQTRDLERELTRRTRELIADPTEARLWAARDVLARYALHVGVLPNTGD